MSQSLSPFSDAQIGDGPQTVEEIVREQGLFPYRVGPPPFNGPSPFRDDEEFELFLKSIKDLREASKTE